MIAETEMIKLLIKFSRHQTCACLFCSCCGVGSRTDFEVISAISKSSVFVLKVAERSSQM